MTLNSVLFYIGAVTRFLVLHFFVFPVMAVGAFAALASSFSFENFFSEAYGYASKVSQLPAESVLHVNQEVCKKHSQTAVSVERGNLPPPVRCEEWGLKSVLISDAARETAEVAKYGYLILVFSIMFLCIGFNVITGKYRTVFHFFESIAQRFYFRKGEK